MATKHAALPWTAYVGNDGGFGIEDAQHLVICSRGPWPSRAEESAANAAFIVRAVNNIGELAEAASDYARLIQVERFPLYDMAVHRAYERLRKAIDALAEPAITSHTNEAE